MTQHGPSAARQFFLRLLKAIATRSRTQDSQEGAILKAIFANPTQLRRARDYECSESSGRRP